MWLFNGGEPLQRQDPTARVMRIKSTAEGLEVAYILPHGPNCPFPHNVRLGAPCYSPVATC